MIETTKNDAVDKAIDEGEQALAAQFDSMLEQPIMRVENFEDPEVNEEDFIESDKRRVLQWINWITFDYATLKANIDQMKDEEEWCLKWLVTTDVKKALQPEFLDEVLTTKYDSLNQKAD